MVWLDHVDRPGCHLVLPAADVSAENVRCDLAVRHPAEPELGRFCQCWLFGGCTRLLDQGLQLLHLLCRPDGHAGM